MKNIIEKDDVDALRELVNEKGDNLLSTVFDEDWNAVHLAAYSNATECLAYLVKEKKMNVSSASNEGLTPLHLASLSGREKAIEWLLGNGADLEAIDKFKQTPLHFAAKEENLKIIKLLLQAGADCEAKNEEGETPLFTSLREFQFNTVKILIEKGAHTKGTNNKRKSLEDVLQELSAYKTYEEQLTEVKEWLTPSSTPETRENHTEENIEVTGAVTEGSCCIS